MPDSEPEREELYKEIVRWRKGKKKMVTSMEREDESGGENLGLSLSPIRGPDPGPGVDRDVITSVKKHRGRRLEGEVIVMVSPASSARRSRQKQSTTIENNKNTDASKDEFKTERRNHEHREEQSDISLEMLNESPIKQKEILSKFRYIAPPPTSRFVPHRSTSIPVSAGSSDSEVEIIESGPSSRLSTNRAATGPLSLSKYVYNPIMHRLGERSATSRAGIAASRDRTRSSMPTPGSMVRYLSARAGDRGVSVEPESAEEGEARSGSPDVEVRRIKVSVKNKKPTTADGEVTEAGRKKKKSKEPIILPEYPVPESMMKELEGCPVCRVEWEGRKILKTKWKHIVTCRPDGWQEGDPIPDTKSLIIDSLHRVRRLLADPAASSQATLLQSVALNRQPHAGQSINILGPDGKVISKLMNGPKSTAKGGKAGKRTLAGLPPDIRIRPIGADSRGGIALDEEVDDRLATLFKSSGSSFDMESLENAEMGTQYQDSQNVRWRDDEEEAPFIPATQEFGQSAIGSVFAGLRAVRTAGSFDLVGGQPFRSGGDDDVTGRSSSHTINQPEQNQGYQERVTIQTHNQAESLKRK